MPCTPCLKSRNRINRGFKWPKILDKLRIDLRFRRQRSHKNVVGSVISGHKSPKIKLSRFLLEAPTCDIFIGKLESSGRMLGVKRIKLPERYASLKFMMTDPRLASRKLAINEVKMLQASQHKYVLKYFDYTFCGNSMYLITELLSVPLLSLTTEAKSSLDCIIKPKLLFYVLSPICSAVKHLHKLKIVHRDIKVENIMLDTWGIPKLLDFGFATKIENDYSLTIRAGTHAYHAPEMLNNLPYGRPVDIWSLGITFFFLLHSMEKILFRFDGLEMKLGQDVPKEHKQETLDFQFGFRKMQRYSEEEKKTKNFIRTIVEIETGKRMTAKELCNTPPIRKCLSAWEHKNDYFWECRKILIRTLIDNNVTLIETYAK